MLGLNVKMNPWEVLAFPHQDCDPIFTHFWGVGVVLDFCTLIISILALGTLQTG